MRWGPGCACCPGAGAEAGGGLGEGGTGKTTLSLNLARALDRPVQLLDCDVEEPNAHLFLRAEPAEEAAVSLPVPEIDPRRCDLCGCCGQACQFNAIAVVKPAPLVFPELCHGCGACRLACPQGAISERPRRIGTVSTMRSGDITLSMGRLDVGISLVPPLIRAVKSRLQPGLLAILDAPPGTSCPVVATVRDCDRVLLVTEPTPFGLNDMVLAVDMARELRVPFGVVINRSGSGDERVKRYCRDQGIPLLLEIPDDRRVAEAYSRGQLMVDVLPEYRALFAGLVGKLGL